MGENKSDSNMAIFIGATLGFAIILFYFTTEVYGYDFDKDTKLTIWDTVWLIPVFPILAFIGILLFGKYDPRKGGSFALIGVGMSSVFSLAIAYDILIADSLHGDYKETTFVWFKGATESSFSFEFGTYVDALAALLLLVVGLVSYLVVVFSTSYMHEEGDRQVRYFAEICLFVGVMLGLIVANSFLLMFIFWELVGVCSYLLIGFWYEKPSAASAAKKAFLVTRVGDVFLLLGLIILFNTFGTLNYRELFDHPELYNSDNAESVKWAAICIFGGAVGKSAQFPLHFWLPDAMEGPTTVSALIHAATMVKAGVFLVARTYPLIVLSPDAAIYIAVTGAVTAFIAASMAMVMNDIKRVLAYSTISQLGYMFLGLGTGAWAAWHAADHGLEVHAQGYMAGLFHLMNHAFFKALLFLGSGAVIHAVHTQDMREMGGLRKSMPITSTAMGLGVLSIAGFPLMSGFWSKDEILESVHHNGEYEGIFGILWWMALLTAAMTAFYMTRLWMMTFSGPEDRVIQNMVKSDDHEETGNWQLETKIVKSHAHEAPLVMTIPLMILAILAVFSGLALVLGDGFGARVYFGEHHGEDGFIQWKIINHILLSPLTHLSVTFGLSGMFLGVLFYRRGEDGNSAFSTTFISENFLTSSLHTFLSNRLYMSIFFNWVGVRTWDTIARACDWFDQNIIDGIVNGVGSVSQILSHQVRRLNTGFTGHYASLTVGGLGALVLITRLVMPVMGWSL